MSEASSSILGATTQWTRSVATPIRAYLRTEAGSAGVLVTAIVAALVWCTVAPGSYESAWTTPFSLHLGHWGLTRELRKWVNSGLMTLFFLVVGLEARREFDLGDLRERRRFLLPCLAGLAGLAVPAGIYVALVHGGPGAHGWGVAMSTDTALALGLLSIIGRRVPDRARIFLLTVFVVDDVAALLIVTVVYSGNVRAMPLLVALCAVAALFVARTVGAPVGVSYAGFGIVAWFGLIASGVDPIILGLVLGLATSAYSPSRTDLERATGLFRLFREQPTPELARSATVGVVGSLSPNARLQNRFLMWTTYVIVPLFALANAGLPLSASFLSDAYTSPITWGVVVGFVVGKPIAVIGMSWLIERITAGRIRPEVGWASVAGSGTIAGIGFTVSFVVAALALHGSELAEAKLGVLSAGVIAAALTWAVYAVTFRLPGVRKARALLGDAEQLIDLVDAVDPERDHIRGPAGASVTLVEYGDLQCPYCGQAEPIVRELLADTDLRYVWRHLPLTDVHPQAQLAAEAAEAAGAQGKFWEMHDLLLTRQDHLKVVDLLGYARDLGLDTDQLHDDLVSHRYADRVAEDVQSADLSGVSGTPTFFVNGQRHYGTYDIDTLKRAIKVARARVAIRSQPART
jgi:Na+/H+ antiporter NhaA